MKSEMQFPEVEELRKKAAETSGKEEKDLIGSEDEEQEEGKLKLKKRFLDIEEEKKEWMHQMMPQSDILSKGVAHLVGYSKESLQRRFLDT